MSVTFHQHHFVLMLSWASVLPEVSSTHHQHARSIMRQSILKNVHHIPYIIYKKLTKYTISLLKHFFETLVGPVLARVRLHDSICMKHHFITNKKSTQLQGNKKLNKTTREVFNMQTIELNYSLLRRTRANYGPSIHCIVLNGASYQEGWRTANTNCI